MGEQAYMLAILYHVRQEYLAHDDGERATHDLVKLDDHQAQKTGAHFPTLYVRVRAVLCKRSSRS